MYPNEVSTMDSSKLLLFCKGLAPIYCNKIRYYEDPIFAERTKIKSPPTSDKVEKVDRKWDYSSYKSLS
jgi:type IV secretory pathway TraG/TraD family ATPase VirD4